MVEILYYDICNLYGDYGNIEYLEKCFGRKNIIYTNISEKPYFLNNNVKLVYMGSCTEDSIELIISKLRDCKKIIKEKIESGVYFLFTGNAIDILSKKIIDGKKEIKGLGIFDIEVERNMEHRFNCHYRGTYNNVDILGFKSEFTMTKSNEPILFKTNLGIGFNKNTMDEGIHYKNFYGTNVLGPLLILNPLFTKELLKSIGYNKDIPLEKELIDAYNFRLEEYKNIYEVM